MAFLYTDDLPGSDAEILAFEKEVDKIAKALDLNPNWITLVMHMESRMNPKVRNRFTQATGLIQFMPATARELGTSIEALRNMTAIQQLPYVYKYYRKFKDKITSFSDLYLATFYPKALLEKWPDNRVFPDIVLKQNPGLDFDKDGKLTLLDFKRKILKRVPAEFPVAELKKKAYSDLTA